MVSSGGDAAGVSAGGAAVSPNATATAAAGPSLAAASGTSIPGKLPLLVKPIPLLLLKGSVYRYKCVARLQDSKVTSMQLCITDMHSKSGLCSTLGSHWQQTHSRFGFSTLRCSTPSSFFLQLSQFHTSNNSAQNTEAILLSLQLYCCCTST